MRFNGPAFGEWMDSASMFARAPQLVRLTPSLVSPASAKIQNPPSLRAINGVVSPLKGIGFYDCTTASLLCAFKRVVLNENSFLPLSFLFIGQLTNE